MKRNQLLCGHINYTNTIAWIDVQEWGEGGEAKLRRLPDGSFDLLTSAKRGGASSGYGTSLNSLSDGARLEVCSKIIENRFCMFPPHRGTSIRHNHESLLWSAILCCPCRDVCALSMLFILPGFISGMQDAPLPFVVLDEPEPCLHCLELMSLNVW